MSDIASWYKKRSLERFENGIKGYYSTTITTERNAATTTTTNNNNTLFGILLETKQKMEGYDDDERLRWD